MDHGDVVPSILLPPDQETSELVHPLGRPLDDPSPCSITWDSRPLRLIHASPRDVGSVPPLRYEFVHLWEVVPLVHAHALWMLLRRLRPLDDDALQRRLC